MLVSNQSELLPNLIGGHLLEIIDFVFKLLLIAITVFVILTWQNVTTLKEKIENLLNPPTPGPNRR